MNPFDEANRLAAFALGTVFVTTILSWIDWNTAMVFSPYDLNPRSRATRLSEQARLFSDLYIVSVYAFLLLSIQRIAGNPSGSLFSFLLGYVLIMFGYFASGVLRRVTYGKKASSLGPISSFLVLYGILLVAYQEADRTDLTHRQRNMVAIVLVLVLMVLYRIARRKVRSRRSARKAEGLVIGFDVDGVLANQIDGVLPRLKQRLGIELRYEDVTHWSLPLSADTDIAKEIVSAMEDPKYVLTMPVHADARRVVEQLYDRNTIRVITARPPVATDLTREWLTKHSIYVDSIDSAKEKAKSLFGTDVLVDDYIGNLREYLEQTNGHGVLVDQPWNRDREELQVYVDANRLDVVSGLTEVPPIIERLLNERTKNTRTGS